MTTQKMPTLGEMFPIPDGAKALERFLGEWEVNGSLTMEGTTLPMAGRWLFEPAAAGFGVRCTLTAEIEGLGAYAESDLVGFDAETGAVHIFSLTNSGAVHDHAGRWVGDDRIEFEFNGTQGGKPFREVGTMDIVAPTRLHLVSTDYVDGAVTAVMEATLTRR